MWDQSNIAHNKQAHGCELCKHVAESTMISVIMIESMN